MSGTDKGSFTGGIYAKDGTEYPPELPSFEWSEFDNIRNYTQERKKMTVYRPDIIGHGELWF